MSPVSTAVHVRDRLLTSIFENGLHADLTEDVRQLALNRATANHQSLCTFSRCCLASVLHTDLAIVIQVLSALLSVSRADVEQVLKRCWGLHWLMVAIKKV